MKKLPFLFFIGIISLVSNCGFQDKLEDLSRLGDTAEDNAIIDAEFKAVHDMVDSEGNSNSDISGESPISTETTSETSILPSCANITFDIPTKTLTIDFGTEGCLCNDGLTRKGKIISIFDGAYRTAGTTATTTLEDYYVTSLSGDEIKIEGTRTITNLGNTETGNFKYSYEVIEGKAITSTGTISWATSGTIERIEGDATITPWDDIYLATGTSNGVSRQGVNYTVTTTEPLKKRISLDCLAALTNFISGVLTLNTEAGNTLILDYDPDNNEACDKKASLQVNNGNPFTIFVR